MGDFFLDLPSNDQIVQVLFEGNSYVVSNLVKLLAIGLSGAANASLADKVAEKYAIKDTLTDAEYYDDADIFSEYISTINAKLLRYDSLCEERDLSGELDEEDIFFMSEYSSLVAVLDEVQLGDSKFTDMIRTGDYTVEDLYPIVACFTEGQKALIKLGQIENVIKHYVPTQAVAEMKELLDSAENGMKDDSGVFQHINVYIGVDRSIFRGAYAMTSEADRQQAINGETWDISKAADASGLLIASYVIAGLGAASACISIGMASVALFYKTMSVATAFLYPTTIGRAIVTSQVWGTNAWGALFRDFWGYYSTGMAGFLAIAGGLVLIAAGVAGIALWYNYYNPEYTEIPNTMIDVKETDLGDKYVKYSAAKVFENGELSEKNADFNAYQGKEWIALYYTKDATAGKCLLPKFTCKNNDASIARRHQGVSMFGETKAFNLNSHVYSENAPGVYLTVRYSTAKKAAADMPAVVGSIVSSGVFYTMTAIAGVGLGVGGTLCVQNFRKKKEDEMESEGSEETLEPIDPPADEEKEETVESTEIVENAEIIENQEIVENSEAVVTEEAVEVSESAEESESTEESAE
jgi:hypothetical protein